MARNTDGSTTIGDTRAEVADVARLMTASETEIVILAIDSNVFIVPLGKLLDSSFNSLDTSGFAHSLGRVVGVTTSTVPVALEGLGMEGNLNTPLLSNADKEVASHPKVVAHGDAFTRADLEFPLRRHYLSVDTADVNASVETGAIVSFDKVTSEDLASAYK